MGRKPKKVELSVEQRTELENKYRTGKGVLSRRCHIVLLKSESRSSKEVAQIVGTNEISVNTWVKRYKANGIDGLLTLPGRGRKTILNMEKDGEKIKEAVKEERQRLKNAKDALEKDLGKSFSMKTLHRFLKSLSAGGSASVRD